MVRRLLIIALSSSLSALSLSAAELPRVQAQQDVKEYAEWQARQNTEAAGRLALSNHGLALVSFSWRADGWCTVGVQNITTSSISFDYHRLRGVELDTGTIVEAGDIKFNVREIASYDLGKYQRRNFTVKFSGRRIAAVAWKERDDWHVGTETFASIGQAQALVHKQLAEQRLAARKRMLRPVEGQPIVAK
jgi:hypothetical protein